MSTSQISNGRDGIPLTQSRAINESTFDLIFLIVSLSHMIPVLVSFSVKAKSSCDFDISSTLYSSLS